MIKLSTLKKNAKNPRQIAGHKLDLLKRSITEFEKMMALRPMVVDEAGIVLGGNMRLSALKALGYKEIPDDWVKRAEDLSEDEKARFTISDNAGFGEWDWDAIANEWTDYPLADWGLDVPGFNDPSEEWQGMPEFVSEDLTAWKTISVHFASAENMQNFAALVGQTITEKTKSIWFPLAEIGRYADKAYKSES